MSNVFKGDEQVWRDLVQAALDVDARPELLRARVKATAGRVIPCERRRDQSAFVALQALARAAGEGTRGRRARLCNCLAELAADCADVAGWERPDSLRPTRLALSPSSLELFTQ